MKRPIQHTISVNGKEWKFSRPILEARRIGDKVIVIFDYMSYPQFKQAQNLVAFDVDRNELWTAEHPTNETADAYVSFISEKPLKVSNFASFDCEIDPATGKLLHAEFKK